MKDIAGQNRQISLLPLLGNTAVLGAYRALLSREARAQIKAMAEKITRIEFSADNVFYGQCTGALFLPHRETERFPTVLQLRDDGR